MSRGHTDAELLIATQVAYLNIEADKRHPVDVGEWMASQKATLEKLARSGELSPAGEAELKTINHLYDMMRRPEYSNIDLNSWNVVDSRNHNTCGGLEETGMYASLIDTGNKEAIIGFRGSESYDGRQKIHDWVESDGGLLNRYETFQQQDAEAYMDYLYRNYGDDYDNFDVTGHSLGGNLAEHATINSPDGMKDKIDRCVNFDGPGFSNEYIATHFPDIITTSGKVDHYSWSVVGGLLIPLPGSHFLVIDAKTPSGHGEFEDQFYRHDTSNVRIVDGHVVKGERDPMANAFSSSSKILELCTMPGTPLSMVIVTAIGLLAGGFIAEGFRSLYHDITDARAEFSVDASSLYEASDMLGSTAATVRGIAEDVRAITESIEYISGSALLCRLKLRNTARSIEGDSLTAYALAGALGDCAEEYISSDRYAAGHLAV